MGRDEHHLGCGYPRRPGGESVAAACPDRQQLSDIGSAWASRPGLRERGSGHLVLYNWIRLLLLAPGESPRLHHEVLWQVIRVLVPLVLATTGWWLWRAQTGEAAGPRIYVVDARPQHRPATVVEFRCRQTESWVAERSLPSDRGDAFRNDPNHRGTDRYRVAVAESGRVQTMVSGQPPATKL